MDHCRLIGKAAAVSETMTEGYEKAAPLYCEKNAWEDMNDYEYSVHHVACRPGHVRMSVLRDGFRSDLARKFSPIVSQKIEETRSK